MEKPHRFKRSEIMSKHPASLGVTDSLAMSSQASFKALLFICGSRAICTEGHSHYIVRGLDQEQTSMLRACISVNISSFNTV